MKKGRNWCMNKNNWLLINTVQIIGASVIGPLHLVNVTPCQDAYAHEVFSTGHSIIAVSDGLGSAFFSDFGSKDAVEASVLRVKQILSKNFDRKPDLAAIATKAAFAARQNLERKSHVYGCELRDLACTLIIVVIHRNNVAVAHIGDGAVVAKTDQGLLLVSSPGDSEYANEVTPITGRHWERSLRIAPMFSDSTGIMVFTDGLQRAALRNTLNGPIPFDRFCDPLFAYAREVIDTKKAEKDIKYLLSSKKICENSEDDKTLVIAVW